MKAAGNNPNLVAHIFQQRTVAKERRTDLFMQSSHQRRQHMRANLKHVQSLAQTFINGYCALHAGVGDGVNGGHARGAVRRVCQRDLRQLINRFAADNSAVKVKEQRRGFQIGGNVGHVGCLMSVNMNHAAATMHSDAYTKLIERRSFMYTTAKTANTLMARISCSTFNCCSDKPAC